MRVNDFNIILKNPSRLSNLKVNSRSKETLLKIEIQVTNGLALHIIIREMQIKVIMKCYFTLLRFTSDRQALKNVGKNVE